jgi:hypothetical protein
MTFLKKHLNCRICHSQRLEPIGSFGEHPLTGVFLGSPRLQPPLAPLDMVTCTDCGLLQLHHEVSREEMYKTYFYRSGINSTMVNYLSALGHELRNEFLSTGDIVIDTGCNDGTFLDSLGNAGYIRIGVDPSDAVQSISDPSVEVINDYFPSERLDKILRGRRAKLITSISMFYDLNDPHSFVEAVSTILTSEGVWVVEMNYTGDMLINGAFDMVSHEHVTYYTLKTFSSLISSHGLRVFRVQRTSINGGSVRFFCARSKNIEASVHDLEKFESSNQINLFSYHKDFFERCLEFKDKFNEIIRSRLKEGKKVAVYGASTRGNTILQFCGITDKEIIFAVDRNPDKIGLYCPGSRIPIVAESFFRGSKVDAIIVLPYGFLREFISRESEFLVKGGEFIIPFPELGVLRLNHI